MLIHVKSTLGLAVVALLIASGSVPTFADQAKPDDGHLNDEEAAERKLNQYSFYVVMEMHTNCLSTDNRVDARLGYPFDVQPGVFG
jgi:hypothetical protein